MYSIDYADSARDDLYRLDHGVAQRIIKKIAFYSTQENPLLFAERLTGFIYGHYRFRIGDYRAIFDVDTKGRVFILMILRIKHRREVYR